MKKRFLFPLIYLILLGISFVIPFVFPVFFLLTVPSILIVNLISDAMGGPVDTTYFVFLGGVLQFFLLGYLWDWIAHKINS